MLTTQQINTVKMQLNLHKPYHENDDNVRIAYEWFDAQTQTNTLSQGEIDLKRLINEWSGGEIAQNDIDAAAYLHPNIKGTYPFYNNYSPLTLPSAERLRGIAESSRAGSQEKFMIENYRFYEVVKYTSSLGQVVKSFHTEELPPSQYQMDDFCAKHDNCKCYYCVYGR
jgi:hypothetical protein